MGFLNNLISNIKNKFSDDKGLFQKNKFVGFGGGNDFANSQLDLGNSNIPLSSTQRPTFQQFKPQIEEPIEQPKLNTTSSIENLKNRIKAIQGLNNIQIKDPVPQIQPPHAPIIDRARQLTSNVIGGAKQIGNNIVKGVNDQVDIQKRDFKDYVIDPLVNTPGQNFGEGTFGGTVYRDLVKPVGRWAQTTGEELMGKTNMDLNDLVTESNLQQKIITDKLAVLKTLVDSGQKDSPQAIKLSQEISYLNNKNIQDDKFGKFDQMVGEKKNQYISDSVKTGMTVAGAGAAAANPMALMLPTAIGGAIGVAGGKDFGEATGEAFSNAVRWKAVTQFTDPAIARTINSTLSKFPKIVPIARQLVARTISGVGNIGEDRIIDKLEQKDRNGWDDLTSFGIAFLLSNGGGKTSDIKKDNWSKWKKDFSKNWAKDKAKSLKLDPKDAKLVEQIAGNMLDKVNKYMTSPEGIEMQKGFVRIPFGPDAEVKPEVDKFAGLDDETRGRAEAAEVEKTMGDVDTPDNSIDLTKSIRDLENKINGTEAGQEAWRKLTNNNSYEEKGDYLKALIGLDKSLSKSISEIKPEAPKVDIANQPKDADTALKLFEEGKKRFSDEKYLRNKLKENGYDISKITIKGEPTAINTIFSNRKTEVGKAGDITSLGAEDSRPLPPKPKPFVDYKKQDTEILKSLAKQETPDTSKSDFNAKQLEGDVKSVDVIATNAVKDINITDKGSCMLATEKISDNLVKNGIKDFKVVEGYIDLGKGFKPEHTWIELKDGTVIDKTLEQFNGWDLSRVKYLTENKKIYSPTSYTKLAEKYPVSQPIKTNPIIKTEPQTTKVTTQDKIVNPSGSGDVVKPKKISDLGSNTKKVTPISEIKPKKETKTIIRNVPTPEGMETKFEEVPKVETPKIEQPKVETNNKFAGEEARVKYQNVDSSTVKNKKLASAIAKAKKLDQWEVNKNAIKSKVADNAWKKVAMIENGTWKEEKITNDTINRDVKEGTDSLNKLIGKINQSETQSFAYAEKSGLVDIKSEDTDKIINAIENTKVDGEEYSPEDIANIKKTKEFWSRALAIGKKLGLNIKETKNYFTHMYAEFQGSNMSGSKNLNQKTPFANSRKYSSYKQAFEEAGLTKAFNNIAEFGTRYMQKNLTTKAKIDFLASMPFKNVEDVKGLDYKLVNKIKGVNIDENDRYLPSKLADMVNGYFADENVSKTLVKTAKFAKFFQDIKLNAGIPFTPANYYGIVQGFKEFQTELGQVLTLKKSPLQTHTFKNFARSFSRNASIEWEKKQVKSIIKMKSVFKLDGEHNLKGMLEGSIWNSIKDKKFGEAINRAMGDATFKRFMFQNMVSSFNESEAKFIKDGMDEKTATKTALTLVEKLYGLQRIQAKYTGSNLEKFLGNKNVSNILQTMLMAKDYKQQMSKMWWNMAKVIKNPGAPENQGVIAYGIGIIATKIAMEAANMISTGKPMEQNPENLKDKAVIGLPGSKSGMTLQSVPGTGFVPKTLTKIVTGNGNRFKNATSFASIPVGLGIDLLQNEDYFGNNITESSDTAGDKAKKVAKYSMEDVISPYVTGLKSLTSILKKKDAGNTEDIKDSEINDLLKAVEFPMNYISKDRFETLHYYDNKKEQYDKLTEDEKVIFDKLDKKGTDFGSKQRDKVADAQDLVNYPNVLNAKRQIAIETAKANGTEVDPLYKLSDEQLRTFYQIQGLTNNSTAQMALKNKNEWYSDLSDERSDYFKELIDSGKMKAQESDYPKANPETQKKLDYLKKLKTPEIKKKQDYYYTLPEGSAERRAYSKANPDLVAYWDTIREYKKANPDIQEFKDKETEYYNRVGEAFGIEPEDKTTSGNGYSGWQNWEKTPPNVYTYLNKITGDRKSTLKKDIDSIIKLSKKDKSSKELNALINKTYKSLSEIFNNKKHK